MADALHMVMDSDRTVYTKTIVNRLVKKDKVIKASEHFEDDQALALPAQMFRFGSEMVSERAANNPDVNFSYSLLSLWPVNKQNAPKTAAEEDIFVALLMPSDAILGLDHLGYHPVLPPPRPRLHHSPLSGRELIHLLVADTIYFLC